MRGDALSPPNDMHPQRRVGTRNIPPQDVEPLVPIVEYNVVDGLEAGTGDLEYLNVLPRRGLQKVRTDVQAIRNAHRGRHLAPKNRRALHLGYTVRDARRRPRALGRSRDSGE